MKRVLAILLVGFFMSSFNAQEVRFLYPEGPPGYENRKDEPEEAKDYWVKNVHNPSITLYKPEKPNGASVLIFPGGGHRILVITSEGKRAAEYFNKLGITAAVVKYRLFREEGSEYTMDHAVSDARQAMVEMRKYAVGSGLDPGRIGLMGFSAGGELVNAIAYDSNVEAAFNVQVYPGPLNIPPSLAGVLTPPAFLVASTNDECCSESIIEVMQAYRKVGGEVELHIYAKGDHAFNMGTRSEFKTVNKWPERLADWFHDYNHFAAPEKR